MKITHCFSGEPSATTSNNKKQYNGFATKRKNGRLSHPAARGGAMQMSTDKR
jgi:hypothetical protein